MKKKLIAMGILSLSLLFGNSSADATKYFMQGNKVGSETPYGNNVAIGQYIDVGDAKIYYEVYGEGKPIFIFHGGGVGSSYELGRIIDDLRQNYQVIAVTTRGHGRSEIGRDPLSYEQKANDMATVMKSITNTPAQIIGFSDGAYTAYKVAAMYPELVDRILLPAEDFSSFRRRDDRVRHEKIGDNGKRNEGDPFHDHFFAVAPADHAVVEQDKDSDGQEAAPVCEQHHQDQVDCFQDHGPLPAIIPPKQIKPEIAWSDDPLPIHHAAAEISHVMVSERAGQEGKGSAQHEHHDGEEAVRFYHHFMIFIL